MVCVSVIVYIVHEPVYGIAGFHPATNFGGKRGSVTSEWAYVWHVKFRRAI